MILIINEENVELNINVQDLVDNRYLLSYSEVIELSGKDQSRVYNVYVRGTGYDVVLDYDEKMFIDINDQIHITVQ